jgi:hypothetical protein
MANPNEADEVNSGALAMVIVVVAFATLAVALVVTALVRQELAEVGGRGMDAQDRKYRDGKNEQLSQLSAPPTWADRAKGLIAVPMDRAMELTLEAVRKNPYAMTPGLKPENLGGAGGESDPAESKQDDKLAPAGGSASAKAPAPPAPSVSVAAPVVAPPVASAP